jgi:hypothetical protein
MTRRHVIALAAVLVFGAVRLPLELEIEREHRAARFNGGRLDLTMREQIGQMGFLAALSGFRALAADALWIHANSVWADRTDWAAMKVDFDAVNALQPRCVLFWDMAAWHMYANASIAALNDRKQPREALRLKAQREYWRLGEDYLLRGIANNPDASVLYKNLGMFVYRDRYEDHCKAAETYARGAKCPDAPVFLKRFAAYELARCPGHEREGYEKLLALYKMGKDEHTPTLLKLLGELQEKLRVPDAEKVDTSAPSP